MKPRLVMLLITMAMFVLVCPAQQSSLSVQLEPVTVSVSNQQLMLVLDDLPPGADWIVGVREKAGVQQATLGIGELRMASPSGGYLPMPAAMVPWPKSSVTVSQGTAAVGGLGKLQGKLFAFLTIPPGTRVRISASGQTVADVAVSGGVMIRRGQVLPGRVDYFSSVLVALVQPMEQTVSDIFRLPSGAYAASLRALKGNLISFQMPVVPAGTTSSSQAEKFTFASVRLEIDPSGNVTSTALMSGDPTFGNACQTAVKSWKFTPFRVDGVPTAVTAVATFAVDPGGQVRSSLI